MNSISDADQRILGPQHVATTLAGMEAPQDSTEPLNFSIEALQISAEAPFGACPAGQPSPADGAETKSSPG